MCMMSPFVCCLGLGHNSHPTPVVVQQQPPLITPPTAIPLPEKHIVKEIIEEEPEKHIVVRPQAEEVESLPLPKLKLKLIPIESYNAATAWRKGEELLYKRVRLTGEAEVKRSTNGVYVAFVLPTGKKFAVVSVKNEYA